MVRDCFRESDWQPVSLKLKLIGNRKQDGRQYNLPTTSEVAGLIIGDIDVLDKRDIILRTHSGGLQRISELHPSYLALQYPLLFPYAEDGYRVDIKHRGIPGDSEKFGTKLTMREFFCYLIQDRPGEFSLLLHSRKLFHQFLVDAYTMIESDRLNYIRTQQKKLRTDTFKNLTENIENGNNDASSSGKRILLPSSFTGGSRYMMQKYLDAMAICKSVGYPDLFITVTCNPMWSEIYRCLVDEDLKPEDRPDILARMFKIKLDEIINDFQKEEFFGPIQAVIYTVEFQKRGLPHAHICLFLAPANKFPNVSDVDRVISAEIPNQKEDPVLYELVKQFMMHGPCGTDNLSCPCMVQRKCSKYLPKKWQDETCVDSEGYPVYKWRNTGNTIEKNGIPLDNRFVVPYNATLLRRYQCYINVEWCNQSGSIKYLFKYVFASEATWRIFGFDIHYRYPPVEVLPFHCENEHSIVYDDEADLCDVVSNPTVKHSMFLQWMELNATDHCKNLEICRDSTILCLGTEEKEVETKIPELDRILLNHVVGPTSFKAIKRVNGKDCATYKEACFELGLLDDDKEYVDAILEALELQEQELQNLCLSYIEQLLLSNGSTLKNFPEMPFPGNDYVSSINNRLIRNELLYDQKALLIEHQNLFSSLTVEQKELYQTVIQAVSKDEGGVYFVYGYGGIGKTFLWKTLTAAIRSKGQIVLNVASSGIASLLLTGGRTTHSRFVIQININENSICSIDPNSELAALIKITKLIIWDEEPMIHKHCFEALDKSMRDILRTTQPNREDRVFGRKVVIFGGDFRQILPVIPKG
uniref:uncharacterized protein LOC122610187 n=1 Tax=Erigeron canadensis TaxID=72917 RepID=UPI001CB930D4|nr:uncharacterized protein LOC122610187 [Erigeron canadensis]